MMGTVYVILSVLHVPAVSESTQTLTYMHVVCTAAIVLCENINRFDYNYIHREILMRDL